MKIAVFGIGGVGGIVGGALAADTPDAMSSLYRDLSNGKPARETELDHIIGRMVEMGRRTGVPTPYHTIAYERFAGK